MASLISIFHYIIKIKDNWLKANKDNIDFDPMCCLNCKSQIEIKLIKFNGCNKEDSII